MTEQCRPPQLLLDRNRCCERCPPDRQVCDECRDFIRGLQERETAPKQEIDAELAAAREENARLREVLREAVDIFEGLDDDEINEEFLPKARSALNSATQEG